MITEFQANYGWSGQPYFTYGLECLSAEALAARFPNDPIAVWEKVRVAKKMRTLAFCYLNFPALAELRCAKNLARARIQREEEQPKNFEISESRGVALRLTNDTYRTCGYKVEIAQQQVQGEDTFIVAEVNLFGSSCPLFGVFDGHVNSSAAVFMKRHLARYLKQYLRRDCIKESLEKVCVELNKAYSGDAGTTATFAFMINKELWIANVGDSRAILSDGTQLTEDAKPDIAHYKQKILAEGGTVSFCDDEWGSCFRVDGCLAMARSIGDHRLGNHVSAKPKVTHIPARGTLIIASDGLWDAGNTKEVASYSVSANDLVRRAYGRGSQDDITVLSVNLDR